MARVYLSSCLQRLRQSMRLQRVFTASPIAPPRGFAAPRHARFRARQLTLATTTRWRACFHVHVEADRQVPRALPPAARDLRLQRRCVWSRRIAAILCPPRARRS